MCTCACTRAVYTAAQLHGPSCRPTWQVGMHGQVQGPKRHVTVVCGQLRPCTRRCMTAVTWPCRPFYTCTRVHGRYTAVYAPCMMYTAAVYTASAQPHTRTCGGPVHGCVHVRCTRPAVYTAMYTTDRAYTAVYTTDRVHGSVRAIHTACTQPCTRPMRPVHGLIQDTYSAV